MANRLWPFSRPVEKTKNTPEEVALTVALGAELSQDNYSDTGQDSSLSYYADNVYTNAVVFSCVRELATSVSSIEFNAVTLNPDGEFTDFDGPLGQLIRQPNPDQTTVDFIEVLTEQLIIYGNVYIFFERAGRGGSNARINAMYLLRPDLVTIKTGTGEGSINGVESYEYEQSDTKKLVIPSGDIAHLKYPNSTTGAKTGLLYGLSPLSILKNDVLMDDLVSDLSMSFIKRGAVPSGLLKLNKRVTSQEDADEVRNRWRSTFSGKQGQWNVAILDSDSSYETLQALPKDLALAETRDEVVARICGVLGIPPIIIGSNLGLRRSTYSNYKQAQASYRDETVGPLANRIERFFNLKIAPNFSGNAIVKIDTTNSPAWAENETEKVKRVKTLFDSGIISLNEARQELGIDPIDRGDVRRTPSNIFEIGIGEEMPVLSAGDPEKWLNITGAKALDPSLEAESPPIERNAQGPFPIPRAAELINSIRKQEESHRVRLANDLQRVYFKPLKNRIDGVLGRRLEDATNYQKEYPFQAEDLVPAGMGDELATLLEATALFVLKSTYADMRDSGIVPTVNLDEKNRYAQRSIQRAGANGYLIHNTTTDIVKKTLTFGLSHGLTIEQLANGGILPDGTAYKGLRGIIQDASANRLPMIARTEVAQMTNMSTLSYYDGMGADFVQCIDGDTWDSRCADRNGKIFTVQDASDEMEHPNGIMDFIPAVEQGASLRSLTPRAASILVENNKEN
tara:strand:- start:4648 stop:6864 length:2217 start_codon:yes stop_codon:yes gene_type:complete